MALTKSPVNLTFTGGLDTKSDPNQVQFGKFATLNNTVFTQTGALTKRNGFGVLTTLPNANQTTLTTLNNNLVATGSNLYALSEQTGNWLNQGTVQPVDLHVMPLVRGSTSQSANDGVVSANGLVCTVYVDSALPYVVVSDVATGQQVFKRTALPATAVNMRVTVLGSYFVVSYVYVNGSTPTLAYQSILTTTPTSISATTTIDATIATATAAFDTYVMGANAYYAYPSTTGAMKLVYMTPAFAVSSATSIAGEQATIVSLTADAANSILWLTYLNASTAIKTTSYSALLASQTTALTTVIATTTSVLNITSIASGAVNTILSEIKNTYSYTPNAQTDYIRSHSVTQAGTATPNGVILRSVGLASRAFLASNGTQYVIATYGEANQPTYFLIDVLGNIFMRLAYSNGGGYQTGVLPSISTYQNAYWLTYLYADNVVTVNKSQLTGATVVNGQQVNSIIANKGINLASFAINQSGQATSEIAQSLHLTGGQLWQYDGIKPVEHGFHVWPENVGVAQNTNTKGGMKNQLYSYSFCYEWTDGQGNIHRSSPSIPQSVDMSKAAPAQTPFKGTWTNPSLTITVASTAGLQVGQLIIDATNPAALASGTYIVAIPNSTTITINNATVAAPQAGGDQLYAQNTTTTSVFTANKQTIIVSTTTGLHVGQVLADVTTSGALAAGTYITSIDTTTNTVGLSQLTQLSTTADTVQTPTVNFTGSYTGGGSFFQINKVTASSVAGLYIGQGIVDNTLGFSAQITNISGSLVTFTPSFTRASGSYSDSFSTVPGVAGSVFYSGSTTIPVSSTGGFFVGQTVTDTLGAIPAGTTITAVDTINSNLTLSAATTSSTAPDILSTSTIYAATVSAPTLRLTYKTAPNAVRIVGYRWSTAQPIYYQFTSFQAPTINDTTIDSITITDTLNDYEILGNTLLYTTGGVVENIAAPASSASALFKSRLFLVSAEDRNLITYSKQVIEGTPVEMSDLFTLYIAPTTGTQSSTGGITALTAMDDKLVVFKQNAIYYLTGTGPDNTGASNDLTDPVYVQSSVGCTNPSSVVLMKDGLMFQSTKGIWLLDRGLNTSYIGAPVEAYNNQVITSATAIPNSNQVRFTLASGGMLVYDYYQQQWATFSAGPAISGTLQNGLQTYLTSTGAIYQETPAAYLDGASPVLMNFTTSWASFAGLQGFERFYEMYVLGRYYTPFTLAVSLAYDYNPAVVQTTTILPDNASTGRPQLEARVFPQKQKCESFQVTVQEQYDPSAGIPAGQGLSLSGLNLVVGGKRAYRTQRSGQSFG